MVCCLLRRLLRNGLKGKVEALLDCDCCTEDVKAAAKEWLDTFSCGATNGTATEKLVAAL